MGHIDGKPVGPGAHKLRGKLVECARAERPAKLVILFHDTDGDAQIAGGARQVLEWSARQPDLPAVAIGTANPEGEAWLLAATALDDHQRQRLAEATRVLKFGPSRHPERLTSQPPAKVTDAKRVVQFVLLGAGNTLATGRPASKSPAHDEVDSLARRLATDLHELLGYEACGLAPFVRDLGAAVARLLTDRLPAG